MNKLRGCNTYEDRKVSTFFLLSDTKWETVLPPSVHIKTVPAAPFPKNCPRLLSPRSSIHPAPLPRTYAFTGAHLMLWANASGPPYLACLSHPVRSTFSFIVFTYATGSFPHSRLANFGSSHWNVTGRFRSDSHAKRRMTLFRCFTQRRKSYSSPKRI